MTWMALLLMSLKSQHLMQEGLLTRGSKVRLKESSMILSENQWCPMITSLKTAKDCFDTLVNLYENKAPSQKSLEEEATNFEAEQRWKRWFLLHKDCIGKSSTHCYWYYCWWWWPCANRGWCLPSSSETFMASISGRENQPTFERLWHDCIEEEGPLAR